MMKNIAAAEKDSIIERKIIFTKFKKLLNGRKSHFKVLKYCPDLTSG
jgi:hypothetical protein